MRTLQFGYVFGLLGIVLGSGVSVARSAQSEAGQREKIMPTQARAPGAGDRVSWDSREMKELERLCRIEPKKGNDDSMVARLSKLLPQRFSKQQLHELAASCATMPAISKERSDFSQYLLNAMVINFVDAGDRDGLVTLLSTRCPRQIAWDDDIEFYLVLAGKNLKDPILVLGEAYSKATDVETRKEIAEAVRHAFTGSGVRGKDDAEFVANAMQWYTRNKDELTLNKAYWLNIGAGPLPPPKYEEHPLFKKKAPKDSPSPGPKPQKSAGKP
jgi:hypothetical protein